MARVRLDVQAVQAARADGATQVEYSLQLLPARAQGALFYFGSDGTLVSTLRVSHLDREEAVAAIRDSDAAVVALLERAVDQGSASSPRIGAPARREALGAKRPAGGKV